MDIFIFSFYFFKYCVENCVYFISKQNLFLCSKSGSCAFAVSARISFGIEFLYKAEPLEFIPFNACIHIWCGPTCNKENPDIAEKSFWKQQSLRWNSRWHRKIKSRHCIDCSGNIRIRKIFSKSWLTWSPTLSELKYLYVNKIDDAIKIGCRIPTS